MIEYLIAGGILIVLIGIGIGVYFLKKNEKISGAYQSVLYYAQVLLPIAARLNNNISSEYQDMIDEIIEICIDGFNFVDAQDDLSMANIDEKIKLAKIKAYELCARYNIEVTEEFKAIVDSIYDIAKAIGLLD